MRMTIKYEGMFKLEVKCLIYDIFHSGVVFHCLHSNRPAEGWSEPERERRIADIGTITLHFCVICL